MKRFTVQWLGANALWYKLEHSCNPFRSLREARVVCDEFANGKQTECRVMETDQRVTHEVYSVKPYGAGN